MTLKEKLRDGYRGKSIRNTAFYYLFGFVVLLGPGLWVWFWFGDDALTKTAPLGAVIYVVTVHFVTRRMPR